MKGFRVLSVFIAFIIFVGAYYFVISPILSKDRSNFLYKDDFSEASRDFWFVGDFKTHKELKLKDFVSGILKLGKNKEGKDVYVAGKPVPIKKGQVLIVRRKLKVNPGNEYFAGGIALFQTMTKTRQVDTAEKRPFGSLLLLVEYGNDPGGVGKRPGDKNIRLLAPDFEESGNYVLMDPLFGKWFEEEIRYNASTGEVTYTVNGEEGEKIKVPALTDKYIRVWMHSYGKSASRGIEVDNIEIEVKTFAK